MPPRPRMLPDSLGESFSVRRAMDAGVSERRLRHPDLDAPFRGVRVQHDRLAAEARERELNAFDPSPSSSASTAFRETMLVRARAYARIARPQVFFSHVTAALWWGAPLPLHCMRPVGIARELDVAVHPPHRAPRGVGVRGRQLKPTMASIRMREGVRVSSPASTWAQLGEELSVDELIAVGDAMVNEPRLPGGARAPKGSGLATLAQLEAALLSGRRLGASKLRAALPQIRVGSASSPETSLRLALIRAGLPEPVLDVDVLDVRGELIGYTEFAYPENRVLLEYEGDHHRTSRAQWYRDIDKHARCVAAAWTVLRITAAHLYPDPTAAIALVRDALVRAGWRPWICRPALS